MKTFYEFFLPFYLDSNFPSGQSFFYLKSVKTSFRRASQNFSDCWQKSRFKIDFFPFILRRSSRTNREWLKSRLFIVSTNGRTSMRSDTTINFNPEVKRKMWIHILGWGHSTVDMSAPSILPPWVRVPSIPSKIL